MKFQTYLLVRPRRVVKPKLAPTSDVPPGSEVLVADYPTLLNPLWFWKDLLKECGVYSIEYRTPATSGTLGYFTHETWERPPMVGGSVISGRQRQRSMEYTVAAFYGAFFKAYVLCAGRDEWRQLKAYLWWFLAVRLNTNHNPGGKGGGYLFNSFETWQSEALGPFLPSSWPADKMQLMGEIRYAVYEFLIHVFYDRGINLALTATEELAFSSTARGWFLRVKA